MAYQGISTGSGPNTGTGDTILDGAIKINSNFKEIYTALGDGSNILPNISEKITILTSGNVANLSFNSVGGNIVYIANPTGPITLNVTDIPTTNFDNRSLTFSVIINQSSVAYACSNITFNGTTKLIKWQDGTVPNPNSDSFDVFSYIGINTVGSGNNVNNYTVIANLNGRYV